MRGPLKIMYVVTRGDTIAGAQRNVLDLASACSAAGDEVHIVSSFADGPFAAAARSEGLPFHAVEALRPGTGPLGMWQTVRDLTVLVRRLGPDVIHGHSTKAGLLARVVALRAGTGSVFSAHGWAFTPGVPVWRRAVGLMMELCARVLGAHVLCASKVDHDLAQRLHVTPTERLHMIQYGMADIAADSPTNPPRDQPLALMVARFEAQKDHETLLRGFARVQDLAWHLDLVGDGPLLPAMEGLAAELGIADRVTFLGYREDTPRRVAAADLFVLITHYEGLPLSVMEAIRAGVPVVATRVGGIPQMVIPGETGWLAEPEDAASVGAALRAALGDPSQRTEAGKRARALYESEFTLDRMIGETRRVYQMAMA